MTRQSLHPKVVAHRGWHVEHPENTVAAVREAREQGCRWAEFDVRRAGDGSWIVNHDVDLERVFGVPLVVADNDVETLRRDAPVPLLEEALDEFRADFAPIVEIKEMTAVGAADLAELLARHRTRTPLVTVARGPEMPEAFHDARLDLPLLYYTRDWKEALARDEPWLAGYDLPRDGIELDAMVETVRGIVQRNKKLAVWTVNDREEGCAWLDAGVEWLISNEPWKFTA